jgi:RNA polymerase sigma-70 factor (ECF subfamily)
VEHAAEALRSEPTSPKPARGQVNAREFAALYSDNASFVWRVLRGMGVHSSVVPDAVQDVFIVVHRRYPDFDHGCQVRTWLFEIAYRVAKDHRRKWARTNTQVSLGEELQSSTRSPAEQLERQETAELLGQLLDKLDEDKRMVLVLADIEGLTAPEIAELTGLPLNTIYTRLRRARGEFSAALAKHKRSRP